ncbi:hypothetical protein BJ741DRAFT_245902 [Chytriomyces cf. hyalinus JEL632]|nr:hypothetical protein BJ741DRAFT_245902 [Chytriomyces cf. hyalinus JEL632]
MSHDSKSQQAVVPLMRNPTFQKKSSNHVTQSVCVSLTTLLLLVGWLVQSLLVASLDGSGTNRRLLASVDAVCRVFFPDERINFKDAHRLKIRFLIGARHSPRLYQQHAKQRRLKLQCKELWNFLFVFRICLSEEARLGSRGGRNAELERREKRNMNMDPEGGRGR